MYPVERYPWFQISRNDNQEVQCERQRYQQITDGECCKSYVSASRQSRIVALEDRGKMKTSPQKSGNRDYCNRENIVQALPYAQLWRGDLPPYALETRLKITGQICTRNTAAKTG